LNARIRKFFADLGNAFWLIPALMVMGGILAAAGIVEIDRSDLVPRWLVEKHWLYSGGATGARTLLGTVASSTIGVAGTVFSIFPGAPIALLSRRMDGAEEAIRNATALGSQRLTSVDLEYTPSGNLSRWRWGHFGQH
jgi:predicted membrane protein DUF2254